MSARLPADASRVMNARTRRHCLGRMCWALGVLLLAACASRTGGSDGEPGAGDAEASRVIEVERTACFGRCPVYALRVQSDGAVRFEGRDFVAKTGVHETHIDTVSLRPLFARFDAAPFATTDSLYTPETRSCGNAATDMPSVIVRYQLAARRYAVNVYRGCENAPRWIIALAAATDSAVGVSRWIEPEGSEP